jgi:hypothetical protein
VTSLSPSRRRLETSGRAIGAADIRCSHPPSLDDIVSFGERCEHIVVEALVAKLAVEAFDEDFQRRLTRRDIVEFYAVLCRPRKHRQAR